MVRRRILAKPWWLPGSKIREIGQRWSAERLAGRLPNTNLPLGDIAKGGAKAGLVVARATRLTGE